MRSSFRSRRTATRTTATAAKRAQRIEKEDFNLNVSRYFQEQIEGYELKDLLQSVAEEKNDLPTEGKCIDISDLKKAGLNNTLDADSIKLTPIKKGLHKRVEQSCLLLSA